MTSPLRDLVRKQSTKGSIIIAEPRASTTLEPLEEDFGDLLGSNRTIKTAAKEAAAAAAPPPPAKAGKPNKCASARLLHVT